MWYTEKLLFFFFQAPENLGICGVLLFKRTYSLA